MAKKENTTVKRASIYQKSNKKLLGRFDSFITRDQVSENIFNSINNGENVYLRSHRLESTNYDPKWLIKIEDCIPELGDIIKNPRKVTKTVTDIVPVELARKTNDESVRHLASHSQYVKSIAENGDIIPNKILNIGTDDDYITYENKFIATLVKRLVVFIEKRYEFITQFAPLKEIDVLKHKTKAVVDGSIVEIETKIKVTKSAHEDVEGESNAYIKRIERVRTYMLYYMGSDFMKMFKNEKDVRGQILQTNIIRKNPKYHKCYELYRYITSYNQLGIDYKVNEQYYHYTDDEMKDINKVAMSAFLSLNHDGPSKVALAKEKKYKPRILTSIDDDPFVYGPIINKPIMFLRADEEYFKEERKTIPEIIKRPTKEEAEYQKADVEKKKKLDEEERKIAALKKRREKELKEFEKKQAILLEQQRKREAARLAAEEARRRKEELDRIERARKELKATAIEDRKLEEEKRAEEQKRLEEEIQSRSGIEQDVPAMEEKPAETAPIEQKEEKKAKKK